jgi:hypothetical protein
MCPITKNAAAETTVIPVNGARTREMNPRRNMISFNDITLNSLTTVVRVSPDHRITVYDKNGGMTPVSAGAGASVFTAPKNSERKSNA